MKLRYYFSSILCAVLLSACASVQNVSLEKTSRPPIKSVALIRVAESQYFMVRDFSGMSALGGIIGGAVQGSVDQKRAKQFLQAVNDRHVRFGDIMASDLKEALLKAGIQMEYLPDQAPKLAADGKSDDYSGITTNDGAILNTWFGATGFVNTAGFSTEYQPWLIVNVRLVDPATKAIIYQKTFDVGYKAKIANAIFIPLDPKYQFGNFDDVMSRVDLAIEALSTGEALVASNVVSDIK